MIRTLTLFLAFSLTPALAIAQQQQAGNEASTNTEATFQALIDQCDNIDALMLRARIRLQIPRTTDDAAGKAQEMLDNAFAKCGAGDLDGAKIMLQDALKIAEAGATESLGTDASN